MSKDDEEKGAKLPAWVRETVTWLGCLVVAVMPTVMIVSLAYHLGGPSSSVWSFTIYIAVFTLFVVVMKPWSMR